jgi:cell division septum initiation protein DivIVA
MRTTIPEEIKLGEKIQQERERVIAQAEEEGQRIIQLAQEDADRLLEEHQVIRAAQQRADTVLERAQREAEALRSDADEYARGVLVSLDDQLASVDDQIAILITTVRNGLNTLAPPETPEPEEFED